MSENQQDVIESLRQQLADMTKERDKAKAMPMRYRRMEFNAQLQDENESLRQQLETAKGLLREGRYQELCAEMGRTHGGRYREAIGGMVCS